MIVPLCDSTYIWRHVCSAAFHEVPGEKERGTEASADKAAELAVERRDLDGSKVTVSSPPATQACSDGSGGRAHCVPTGMPVAMATFELHKREEVKDESGVCKLTVFCLCE
ncbi:Beta-ureidopropionase [Dissostichus eleginoides]|uniref:Beta-ureidopropionase n=1 Tax=Dissostichus eleginoides TaxID=100907 RepID=A0AAD9ESI1_DISEL|nr:Beta-ureidopropionase [Dissostichus eleginoides]